MTYAIAMGCSHTAGVGIAIHDCYVSCISRHYDISVLNQGVPSGNHTQVLMNITSALKNEISPRFIIAQWPNPIRCNMWINGVSKKLTISNANPLFNLLLKNGEENFYEPWLQSIIVGNLLCKLANVPIINILLEDIPEQYRARLNNEHIKLHVDQKLPGLTWIFDSAADDNLHHSAASHAQWTKRIIGLIDETTTR